MAATSAASPTAGGRWLKAWLRRRQKLNPPLRLGYRQIFILPTGFGCLLAVLMGGMLAGSLNFNNNLGLLTAFIVAGLGINAILLTWRNLHATEIRHGQAEPVFAGQDAVFRLTVADSERRARPGMRVVHDQNAARFGIPAGASAEVNIGIPTRRRGWLDPGRLRIETDHPLGLARAWSWFWPERGILVWPRPARHAPPLPRTAAAPGRSDSRHTRSGEDFFSLREWREGDPLHRIAWKASQRHQTLLARELRDEQARELTLDLDAAPGRDLEQRIAVLTAWVIRAENWRLTWTLRLGARVLGPDEGREHRNHCLRALAEL